jgi:hypothetical protein
VFKRLFFFAFPTSEPFGKVKKETGSECLFVSSVYSIDEFCWEVQIVLEGRGRKRVPSTYIITKGLN